MAGIPEGASNGRAAKATHGASIVDGVEKAIDNMLELTRIGRR